MAVKNVSRNENKFFFCKLYKFYKRKGTLFQYVNQTDLIR
jgi:hypothetical protein